MFTHRKRSGWQAPPLATLASKVAKLLAHSAEALGNGRAMRLRFGRKTPGTLSSVERPGTAEVSQVGEVEPERQPLSRGLRPTKSSTARGTKLGLNSELGIGERDQRLLHSEVSQSIS